MGAALLLSPSSRQPASGGGQLPAAALSEAGGARSVPLAACSTPRCLTVVVAPWCGYCRSSTAKILELRRYLTERKVETRIVVGMDKEPRLKDYAAEFGPTALLDPAGELSVRGVPHFIVSLPNGEVVQTQAGVPPGGIQDVAEFAAHFGLP